jgi:hypothetical protein
MAIVGRLLSGVGADSRTFRFGNYAIGNRSQSEAMGLFTGLHRLWWGGHLLGRAKWSHWLHLASLDWWG